MKLVIVMYTKIKIEKIVEIARQALGKYGLSIEDIEIVISHLLQEELMGKSSHGFYRIPSIINNIKINGISHGEIKIEKDLEVNVLVNGSGRLGLIVAQEASKIAIERAKKFGVSLVGTKNYIGTTGAMGYYTRRIADSELIGIVICNSEYAVAPWGGKDAILGTNPISIGIPTSNSPIVIDFATSARTYGELMLAAKENKKIPTGIVLDKEGKASTNPNDANDGCQLPMAEHKGYGLGLAIEILAGILVGGKAGKNAVLGSDGFLVIAIKPDLFVSLSQFKLNTDLLIDEIKNSPLAQGFKEIRIPGESSYKNYVNNKKSGYIEVLDSVIEEMKLLIS